MLALGIVLFSQQKLARPEMTVKGLLISWPAPAANSAIAAEFLGLQQPLEASLQFRQSGKLIGRLSCS